MEETCCGHETNETISILVSIANLKSSDPVFLAVAFPNPCVEVSDDELVEGFRVADDFFQLSIERIQFGLISSSMR